MNRWEAIRYTYIIALDDIKEVEDYYIVQKWLFCQNKWIKINGLSYHDYLFLIFKIVDQCFLCKFDYSLRPNAIQLLLSYES
jgi:hypothetical protein